MTAISLYTCTERDLLDFDNVGEVTASRLIELRESVLRGDHEYIQIRDVENVNYESPDYASTKHAGLYESHGTRLYCQYGGHSC